MTKEEYKKMIVDAMKENGDYNKGYDPAIDTLVYLQDLACDVHEKLKLLPDPFIDYTDKDGNVKKIANPIMGTFFDLENKITVYLDMLGLGPK